MEVYATAMAFKRGTKSAYIADNVLILDPEIRDKISGHLVMGSKTHTLYTKIQGKPTAMSLATYVTGIKPTASTYWHRKNGNPFDYRAENLELRPMAELPGRIEGSKKRGELNRQKLQKRSDERLPDEYIGIARVGASYYANFFIPGSRKKVIRPGGGFKNPEDAARAYDAVRVKYGFQAVNFPEDHKGKAKDEHKEALEAQ